MVASIYKVLCASVFTKLSRALTTHTPHEQKIDVWLIESNLTDQLFW